MSKNLLLPGCFLFAAVCFYWLPACHYVVGATPLGATGPIPDTFMENTSPQSPAYRNSRARLQAIYTAELGVREATGHNDGPRVATYLSYTGLGTGYDWCASFISWCYGQAGHSQPRNPWSPALFPKSRVIWSSGRAIKQEPQPGDVFGIWNNNLGRIAHVGFVDQWTTHYALTLEGNSNDAVERRRRPLKSIYQVADWLR